MSNEQSTTILSADYATAERTLNEGITNADAELIALALKNPHLEIKLRAAETLGEIGDKQSIPHLKEALRENQVVYTGGSETKALQIELNKALITALRS
ncbi:MAG: HEAT repeat domain-containing protein [Candidatus Competibacteraceae bacterium]